ncbi:MAG: hypothetical protein BMS9Abin02_1289 [Anaerolineae bacterium]|nr:MAG: hypothetical protein BMS9Abin02_1289 [Anaerolineae bacterium]
MDGIPEQTTESVEVIHLNLLLGAGRDAAGRYGVQAVPATVLLDKQGQLLDRQTGRPNANLLIERMRFTQNQSHLRSIEDGTD